MDQNLSGIRAGIVTVSDSCFQGTRRDDSGPALEHFLVSRGACIVDQKIVADDQASLTKVLKNLLRQKADVILTTGGTGLGPRDVTPEATRRVIDKEVPGLSQAMRTAGVLKTRNAVLSRGVCGSIGQTLVLNLPGSPRGAVESLEAVVDVIPHALAMLRGEGHE